MNERQNSDGTWSKAEPIKASWEKKNKKKWSADVKAMTLCISLLVVFWVLVYLNSITLENKIIECVLLICTWSIVIFSNDFRKLFKEREKEQNGNNERTD